MNAVDLINNLRQVLGHIKGQGQNVVPVDRLEAYLATMEKVANDTSARSGQAAEAAQKKFENEIEIWKVQTAHSVEMFKAVIEAGLTALKSAIIINGGAAVALLAFLGSLLKPPVAGVKVAAGNTAAILPALTNGVAHALLIFLVGAGCAGTASATRYLSQAAFSVAQDHHFAKKKSCWNGVGLGFQFLSIILGVLSFATFFYGGWTAYMVFVNPVK